MAYPNIQSRCANLLLNMEIFEYSKGEVGDLQQINKQWNQIYAYNTNTSCFDYQTKLAFMSALNKAQLFFQKYPPEQIPSSKLNQCAATRCFNVQSSLANMLLNMTVYEWYEGEINLQGIADYWNQIYSYEKIIDPSDHFLKCAFNATLRKVEVFFQRYPLNQKSLPPLNQLEITAYVLQHKIKAIEDRARELGIISFYDDQTDHLTGCFGNFHICSKTIQFEGKNYNTAEAIFQAQKQRDNQHIFHLFENTNDDIASCLEQCPLILDQVQILEMKKDVVMMDCLRAKFDHNPSLKALLMASGNAYLINHLPSPFIRGKNYWSDGYDGSGKNNLGICLMKLRGEYGGSGIVQPPFFTQQLLEKFYTKFYAKNASRIDENFIEKSLNSS